jgi:hypothetical protein
VNTFLSFNLFSEVSVDILFVPFKFCHHVKGRLSRYGQSIVCPTVAALLKLKFKVSDLTTQLSNDLSVFGHMVLYIQDVTLHISLNVLGSVSILQSVVGVFITGIGW